jgi:hypothetical protein
MNGWVAWQIARRGLRFLRILFATGEISITKTTGALVQAANYFRGKSVTYCVRCPAAHLILLIS